ncbi:hypothetical protein AQUCO_00201044v1 [Aquilegia coerulea]|uniref:Uncharacterized protein n=1 Tax=Aquilegia coerulea TaxID=218851 RepID=A0A2G5F612_AQUCA|nr:hypothetical protein AQUCO_00201044v1 [Aquilegia coerulea]
MEDWNYLAADGVVICCCCPCAILQVIFFILLKLPYKLASKSSKLVHKKLWKHKKRNEQITKGILVQHGGEQIRSQGELRRILLEGVSLHPYHDCRKTFNEVEKAMEELSQQGHFQFGSFWGRDVSSGLQQDVAKEKFETALHYQYIEMIKNL